MASYPPRLIRMRDAPAYVGMDRHKFSAMVRPHLTEIPLGVQGIAFDRLEIEAWVDAYIRQKGRRPKIGKEEDSLCCEATKYVAPSAKPILGKSRNTVKTNKGIGSTKARDKLAELRQENSQLEY